MNQIRILSVRTGTIRELARPEWDRHEERMWRTAYRKDEVEGRVRVGALGLEGDQQADTQSHGGPQMAVLAYAASHYPLWREDPVLEAMGAGAFGENLSWEGADESSLCVGDAWEGAEVAFEISQPRGPCAAISRMWNSPTLLQRATDTARVGWYLRVTRGGTIARGETLRLVARPQPNWSVERVFRLRIAPSIDPQGVRALATLPELSPGWRDKFAELASRQA